jgi:hypothetical protein
MASALVAVSLWVVLLGGALPAVQAHASETCVKDARAALDAQWLVAFGPEATVQGPKSIETIEREARGEIAKCSHCPQKPFGYQHSEWEQFKRVIRAGDCVVFFRSNPASWNGLFGREGYAL